MPQCNCEERRRLVLTLAHDASLEAAQTLLEHAVQTHNDETVKAAQQILAYALGSEDAGFRSDATIERVNMQDAYAWKPENLTWTGQGWMKTIENVLAKGTPLPVKSGECKIEDCCRCFYESICVREESESILNRSRAVIAALKKDELKDFSLEKYWKYYNRRHQPLGTVGNYNQQTQQYEDGYAG